MLAFLFAVFLLCFSLGRLVIFVGEGGAPGEVVPVIQRLANGLFLGCSFALVYGMLRRQRWVGRVAVVWAGATILAQTAWILPRPRMSLSDGVLLSGIAALVPPWICVMICAWVYAHPNPPPRAP